MYISNFTNTHETNHTAVTHWKLHFGFTAISRGPALSLWRAFRTEKQEHEVGLSATTDPDKVIWEQAPTSTQLTLPPSAIVSSYVHDDVAHRQAQLIVLLSLIVELHHGLHCVQTLRKTELVSQ